MGHYVHLVTSSPQLGNVLSRGITGDQEVKEVGKGRENWGEEEGGDLEFKRWIEKERKS